MQLSILQYKEILEILAKQHGLDLTGYAMFSLKRNFDKFMRDNHYLNFERLREVLLTDKKVAERISDYVVCDYTSLFREPSLWRVLRDKTFPELLNHGRIRVWMPEFNLEELYTLVLVLNDLKCLDKSSILVSNISKRKFQAWRLSELPETDLVQAESNIKRYDPNHSADFLSVNNNRIRLPEQAKRIVNFMPSDTCDVKPAVQPNVVLFRNQMIYHNHIRQHKVLVHIHKHLQAKGYLIIGAKEQLGNFEIKDQFLPDNTDEQIYKRKM